eukprot:TRINITY_DN40509_c0_g1_i1.p1 TRINITY_DN40509_c0_g1~~TRINITY_DN40509_c0_g1_i1.p1  ORF type:complete len:100 (+),score=8.87 TRINITY_DN40509_c0_g1_i1:68-367(+)
MCIRDSFLMDPCHASWVVDRDTSAMGLSPSAGGNAKNAAASRWPWNRATSRGNLPKQSAISLLALPANTSNLHISRSPASAAMCNGRRPPAVRHDTHFL